MRVHEYVEFDAVGLRGLLARGEVSAAEVEAAARTALEAADARVNGLALPLIERPLDYAADGPLAGVPFLIKDSGPMAEGVPFFCGSRALERVRARADSAMMQRFRAAGLATLGLTTVPELLINFCTESARTGITRNPYDPGRGVGGSSGGAAALVASGAVPLAHANDGGGSIRIPASCCGLVGLKPTRGRTPSEQPDTSEFALTRSVRDAQALLGAASEAPGVLRVAVTTRAWNGAPVDAEVAAAALAVARRLEALGHIVEEASPNVDWEVLLRATVAPVTVFTAAPFLAAPIDESKLEAGSRRFLREARELRALELIAAFEAQRALTRELDAFLARYDLLVTPTLAQLPAAHGALRYNAPGIRVRDWIESLFAYGPFTKVFNTGGQPAISLPLGASAGGLPIGVQLAAARDRDALLLGVAAALEPYFVTKSASASWLRESPMKGSASTEIAAPTR